MSQALDDFKKLNKKLIDFNFVIKHFMLRSERNQVLNGARNVPNGGIWMTFSFPLTEKRNVVELLKHLAQHKLSYPGNCVVTVQLHVAHVQSMNSFALGTARTAW